MANSSAKRIVIENNKRIKALLMVVIITHLIFLGITVLKPLLQARSFNAADDAEGEDTVEPPKILFLDENVSKKVKFGYISSSLSILFSFWRLYRMSRPVYSATEPGEIQDPGDHLSMDKGYFQRVNLEDTHRRVYNCVINGAAQTENTQNRIFTPMDMFPTTLAAMGCRIQGDRLGLGTNLYSGLPTLAERLGPEELERELNRSTLPYMFRFLLEPGQGQWIKNLFPNLVPQT